MRRERNSRANTCSVETFPVERIFDITCDRFLFVNTSHISQFRFWGKFADGKLAFMAIKIH